MEKGLKKLFAVLMLLILTLTFSSCDEKVKDEKDQGYDVRVILRECEGITIDGETVKNIKSGRGVTFNVTVNEGYIYIGNTADAEFDAEKGKLRLTNVLYPETIDMIVIPESQAIYLTVKKTHDAGEVSSDSMLLSDPKEVELSAKGTETLEFLGWSYDEAVEDGAELISSEELLKTFVYSNRVIYANFKEYDGYRIVYHLNGGYVSDTLEDTYIQRGQYSPTYALQPTLESNGTFLRDGYVAVGYSTEPVNYEDFESANDIPNFSNMGGLCEVNDSKLDLYVVWAKETDADSFEYVEKDIKYVVDSTHGWGKLNLRYEEKKGIEISGYNGLDDVIVIPEQINGLPVLSIASNAFDCDAKTVVIPRTVKNVADNAFSNCESLKEVVFFDNLVEVSDRSFSKSVKTVVLNAAHKPVYSGAVEGSFSIKYSRMKKYQDENMIIVVSGSSSLNGINGELFEELMPGYVVVNYGTNAANPSTFFLEAISKYVSEGDIVVHAPEHTSSGPMGSYNFHPKVFRGNEQCYDIFRDVDISRYNGFWDSFEKYQIGDSGDGSLVPAVHQEYKDYQLPTTMNMYGDIGTDRHSVRGNFGGANETLNVKKLNYENLNEMNKLITENGAALVMSFGTHDKSRIWQGDTTEQAYDSFTAGCAELLDYPVISNIGTYIMEHKYFYDSEWHCNEEGSDIRTRNLANDIKAWLENPDNY